jgi:hypothetical protein
MTPKPQCLCGEINARHCPVHQEPPKQAGEWLENELINPTDISFSCASAREKFKLALETLNATIDLLTSKLTDSVAECARLREELKLLNEQYAACCVECQGESEENFHLRKELAAAKGEIERLTRLDYSKEDARRNDELEKLKVDMLEAQGYIETQDLKINSLSREVEVLRVSNEILKEELRQYEHETETIKELKARIANQSITIDQCKPESVVALKTENQILKDAFQTASINYPKIIDELKAENEKLKEHFDNCKADKIVTLALERDAAIVEKSAQREKHNQELSDAYKIFQADLDAAIAAKKKAWEGNKQYEILVDSERAEKNAALAKAQAMQQALEFYATYTPRQHPEGYYEMHVAPGEGGEVRFGTFARLTLAKWRGKENEKSRQTY